MYKFQHSKLCNSTTLYLKVRKKIKMAICFYKKCKLCNSTILTFFEVCFFSSYVFIKKMNMKKHALDVNIFIKLFNMFISLKVNLLIVSSYVKDVHIINKKSCNEEKKFVNFLKKQVSDSYNNELHVIYTLLFVTSIC